MRIRSNVSSALLLLSSVCFSAHALSPAPLSDSSLPSSQFDVSEKTQIPGYTLTPGHYSIRMLDHLSDRMVLQVDNDQGKTRSTFLALPSASVGNGRSGAVPYAESKKGAALRGFAFDDGTSVEFVYPKAQAVAIARQNSTKVPAIDPPSEGLPVDNKMSRQDMALVTLWLLSPTYVGSENKPLAVLAQRYQAPTPQTAESQPVVAQNTQPTPVSKAIIQPAPSPKPVQIAQVTRKPILAHLPHTASALPLVWLAGFLSLLGALAFRFKKLTAASVGA